MKAYYQLHNKSTYKRNSIAIHNLCYSLW